MLRLNKGATWGGLVVLMLFPSWLSAKGWTAEKELLIKKQIFCLSVQMDVHYDQQVRKHLQSYLIRGQRETEKILQRATHYFPIFEHYLRLYELPNELKYLPVVESRLIANANSSAGAAGLWQFIKPTARAYGLRINSYVDERYDVYKSTAAAMEMLRHLHEEFGDWTLVIAAYNCGPGRVRKAIKRAGTSEFSQVKRHLPYQTRRYIPKYIATIYAMEHYEEHGIKTKEPSRLQKDIRLIEIRKRLSFRRIAKVCNIRQSELQKLNPSFLKDVIPGSKKSYNLLLPAHALSAMLEYQASQNGETKLKGSVFQNRYVVDAGDSLSILAARFRCSEAEIKQWNNLSRDQVMVHEALILSPPGTSLRYNP